MATLKTSNVLVQQFASALYGIQLGSTTMNAVLADATRLSADGSNGLDRAFNAYYANSFGGMTNAAVANTVVANLGITGAAATEAAAYIANQLAAATPTTKGAVINNVLNVFSNATADATYGAAATAWNAKVDMAVVYAYSNTSDATSGTVPASSTLLTTGLDVMTGNAFQAYSMITQVGAQVDTLQSYDTLTGAGTNPTLTATIGTATIATPTLKGVETVNLTAEGAARTINMANATGVNTINVNNSQQSMSVLAVQANATVGVTNGDGAADTLVRFADSVTSGAADSVKLNLSSNGNPGVASTQTINLSGTNAGGFTTIAVTATGANRVQEILSDAAAGIGAAATATNAVRTVTVDGEGSLRVENAFASTTTFDASANKGGVNVALGAAGRVTVTGGEGNDTFNMAATYDNTDKVDGGAGRDTLVTTVNIGQGNQVSNVEILNFGGALAATFDNDNATSVDAIVHNSTGAMVYQDMAKANAADATKGLTILNTGNVTFNIKGVGSLGHTDTGVYANIGSTNGSALQTVAGINTGTITVDGTSLTLDVKASAGQTSTGTGAVTINNATALTIVGGASGEAFAVGAITNTGNSLTSIDGSTFAGNLTVAGTVVAQVIKGGSGNDVLSTGGRGNATTNGDVLTGGAGNDTFTFAAADSTAAIPNAAVAGAFTAAQKALFTQITDLNLGGANAATAVDLIDLSAINAAFAGATTAIVNGGAATALSGVTFGAAVTAALANTAGLGTAAGSLPGGTTAVAGLYTWGGETFLIATRDIGDANVGYTASEDIVINVTGVTGTLNGADFV